MPEAIEAVAYLKARGFRVFVVTNQSGVARGLYTEAAVLALHDVMQRRLRAANTSIDAIRFCPHHHEGMVEAYRLRCTCRKPQPGMILDLLSCYPTRLDRSFLVGDQPSDLEAARGAGVPALLYFGGSLLGLVKAAMRPRWVHDE